MASIDPAPADVQAVQPSRLREHLERGELQVVLPDWAPIEPAFYIYYPRQRQMPPGLRELIDTLPIGGWGLPHSA